MSMLKLVVYGAVGYVAYQMFFADVPGAAPGQRGGQRRGAGQSSGSAGRSNLTGPGEGRGETAQDSDGGSISRTVGRGVVT